MLGGRVKTLHPRIHAAILARRDHADDVATLEEQDIGRSTSSASTSIRSSEVAGRYGVREEEAVEMIDIGGPSMLRGAAKNFAHVAPVCRPERYDFGARRAAGARRPLGRDAARARGRGVRDDRGVRGCDRTLVRATSRRSPRRW